MARAVDRMIGSSPTGNCRADFTRSCVAFLSSQSHLGRLLNPLVVVFARGDDRED